LIAIDTNLLVYAHRSGLPEHDAARRAIRAASKHLRGWGIPLPCVTEFWSVVTHPQCAGGGSSPRQAQAFLRALVEEGGAHVWASQVNHWDKVARLAENLNVRGPRVFDLQIALAAFENGAVEIWTHDRGFLALPGLTVRDPL
jgi:toxin-antitoxin system PIN domain toxin